MNEARKIFDAKFKANILINQVNLKESTGDSSVELHSIAKLAANAIFETITSTGPLSIYYKDYFIDSICRENKLNKNMVIDALNNIISQTNIKLINIIPIPVPILSDDSIAIAPNNMEAEELLLKKICEVWNDFLALKPQHPSEMPDFADGIHQCQRIIGMRFVRDLRPDIFPIKM